MPSNPQRIQALRDLHAQDPRDPFPAYALAMELAKEPRTGEESVAIFRELCAGSPDYVPAWQQLGLLLARRGDTSGAREALEKGIEAAARTGDAHAAEELRAALESL
jgi:Flp pilus assembly protein TadD